MKTDTSQKKKNVYTETISNRALNSKGYIYKEKQQTYIQGMR